MIYEHTRTRNQRPCEQQPLCIDDYGDAVFSGHYSGLLVWPDDALYLGPIIPQALNCYVDRQEGIEARRLSVRLFEQTEGNCNTCFFLKRIPFIKDRSGLIPGQCKNPDAVMSMHPYPPDQNGIMRFAPEDWQGMPCWKAR